jgi:histidine phosphotransferase ChpT
MADAARSPISLEGLDLAALVASRVCHDVISPVGAIVNGLELMEDGADQATTELALDLIRKSAKTASARLQFCRIAFGAAGSAGSAIDTRDAHQVATNFLNDDRTTIDWHIPPAFLPKNRVKLLLNLLMLAAGAIPRGGVIKVEMTGEGDTAGFAIVVTGLNARIPPACQRAPRRHPRQRAGAPSMPMRSSPIMPACWPVPRVCRYGSRRSRTGSRSARPDNVPNFL